MQAGALLVGLELQHAARIAFRGYVIPEIVVLPVYLAGIAFPLVFGHHDLAPVPVRLDRMILRQPVVEDQNVLVRLHRHTPGIQEACRLRLLPYPGIPQPAEIGTAQQARKRMLAEQQYGSVGPGYALYGIPHPGDVYHGIPPAVCRTVWRV